MLQAAALASRLQSETIDRIESSDLKRARQTAQIIAASHATPVFFVPELREIHFGDWEGRTYASIQASDPEAIQVWSQDLTDFVPPGGESLSQMTARVSRVLENLHKFPDNQNLVIVAHGGPLQVMICLSLGLPAKRYWQFKLDTGSISQISLYPEGAILNFLNDTHHLSHPNRIDQSTEQKI